MKTNQYEIEFENGMRTETSQKNVVVTNDFKHNVEKLRKDLISSYKKNPEFEITSLNENDESYISNSGFPPESEKINEYARFIIMDIANEKITISYPYTYVDEHNEFGGDADDLKICKKLDVRYYQYKKIIDDIRINHLNSDNMKKLDENNSIENKLSNSEYNAVAAQIILNDLYYAI